MGINSVATCDCCGTQLPSPASTDAVIVMAVNDETKMLTQEHYGYVCGCGPRILHAVSLEINKHDQYHKAPDTE